MFLARMPSQTRSFTSSEGFLFILDYTLQQQGGDYTDRVTHIARVNTAMEQVGTVRCLEF